MRRLTRLRAIVPNLSNSTASSSSSIAHQFPPAQCLGQRCLSTRTTRPNVIHANSSKLGRPTFATSRRALSARSDLPEDADIEAFESTPANAGGLRVPSQPQWADPADDVRDPTYTPAESGLELEEVGGLDNWWDTPENWHQESVLQKYGPQELVVDAAELATLVRQAVVEELLRRQTQTSLSVEIVMPEEAKVDVGDGGPQVLLGENVEAYTSGVETADGKGVEFEDMWESVPLDDYVFKFAVAKRLQQLSGHRIPDGKLLNFGTAGQLYSHLLMPPKAKTLADELDMRGELKALPNVNVYARRVTPVDKEKMVGRWKVMVKELKKRELPVLGTGDYQKSIELKWIQAKW